MKKPFLLLLTPVLLASCRHDADTTPAPTTSLVGTWQLTARQCYCAPGLPNETITFSADSTFQYFRDGTPDYSGRFRTGHGHPCAGQPAQPLLTLYDARSGSRYAPSGTYTLSDRTLVVNGGTACVADAPVYTYQRQ